MHEEKFPEMTGIVAQRVTDRLKALGKTARGASLEAGLSADAIRGIMRGMSKTPRGETLQRLSRVLECSVNYLLGETNDLSSVVALPSRDKLRAYVRGAVQAGDWREAVELPREEWTFFDLPADERYPGIERFLLKVNGPSMDQMFPNGSVIECIRFIDLGREPRHEEYVVVHRRRKDGLFEATVKQFMVAEDGKRWLWPRSNDPSYQQPLPLEADGAIEELVIQALVIRATLIF